jgi:hypothetical protein
MQQSTVSAAQRKQAYRSLDAQLVTTAKPCYPINYLRGMSTEALTYQNNVV